MTAIELRIRHRNHTQKRAERHVAKVLHARRTNGHNAPYDLRSLGHLIEVKGVASKQSNPKIHIERDSFERKQAYDQSKYFAILAAVRVVRGKVVETRYGKLDRMHVRYKSLMPEAEFLAAYEDMQAWLREPQQPIV